MGFPQIIPSKNRGLNHYVHHPFWTDRSLEGFAKLLLQTAKKPRLPGVHPPYHMDTVDLPLGAFPGEKTRKDAQVFFRNLGDGDGRDTVDASEIQRIYYPFQKTPT